jgi:hypothetical protein
MTNRSKVCYALTVFVVGLFGGIWMDWVTWLLHPVVQPRNLEFVVQPYEKANLVVYPNDRITWTRLDGKENQYLSINFASGNPPCQGGTPGDPLCILDGTKLGTYFYQCGAGDGSTYVCPDPGIQQKSTGGGGGGTTSVSVSYPMALVADFGTLVGLNLPVKFFARPAPPKTISPGEPRISIPPIAAASSMVLAAVACKKGGPVEVTQENPPQSAGSPINATANQTIWWDGPKDFQVAFPSGKNPCASGGPTRIYSGPWQCVVNTTSSGTFTFPYSATVPGCAAPTTNPEVIVTNP